MMIEQRIHTYDPIADLKARSTRSGMILCVFFLAYYAAAAIMMGIYYAIDAASMKLSYDGNYLVSTVLSVLMMYVLPLVLGVVTLGTDKVALRPKFKNSDYGVGKAILLIPAAYAIGIGSSLLNQLIFSFFERVTSFEGLENPIIEAVPETEVAMALFVLSTVVFAPVFEELIFRGVIMGNLRRFGDKFAIVVSAILFGLAHGNFSQFLFAVSLGLVFGYVAVRANSTKPTIVMHAGINLLGAIGAFMSANEFVINFDPNFNLENITTGQISMLMLLGTYSFLVGAIILTGVIHLIVLLVRYNKARSRGYFVSHMVQVPFVSEARKYGLFFSRLAVILALVLAAFEFTKSLMPNINLRIIEWMQNLIY